jgi:hypothetical protein
VFFSHSVLRLTHLATPPGDDGLVLRGRMRMPSPPGPVIDPTVKGIRFLITGAGGHFMLDAKIPGGTFNTVSGIGWRASKSGRKWLYRNLAGPRVGGIQRIALTIRPSRRRTMVIFTVVGKNWDYALADADLPAKATLVLDAPIARTGECGEGIFTRPDCKVNTKRGRMLCHL